MSAKLNLVQLCSHVYEYNVTHSTGWERARKTQFGERACDSWKNAKSAAGLTNKARGL